MTGIVDALVGATCPYCKSKVEYLESGEGYAIYTCSGCRHEWKLKEVDE